MIRILLTFSLLFVLIASAEEQPATHPISFVDQIEPLLRQNCQKCHRPGKTSGGLNLTSFKTFQKGGKKKTPFKPGDPGGSLVVKLVRGPKPKMPKKGKPLTEEQVAVIEQWIMEGAKDNTPVEGPPPVSFYWNILPIFKRSCIGCHHPGKKKGKLEMMSYSSFKAGGKEGPGFIPGKPEESRTIQMISGEEPEMPQKGDPLKKEEVELIARWIREGAKDDTPPPTKTKIEPPTYTNPPSITSIAYSPDGKLLAIAGYHEVLLHKPDGSGAVARLVGEAPRIETISFSKDGAWLGACGGSPAEFGQVQIWDLASRKLIKAFKSTSDSLFGVSFSIDGNFVAFGGADKTARIIDLRTGKEVLKFENHDDWVFATTYTVKGNFLLTGSRDRAMKMINPANGRFIDDINKLLEPVLCFQRHPMKDEVAYGGELGTPRIYRISDNQKRTAANNDTNLVKAFERQPGPVHSIAYNPDGNSIAVGSISGEVRIYNVADAKRLATLKGHDGAVFTIAYHPKGHQLVTAGAEGLVRIFDSKTGTRIKEFNPFSKEALSMIGKWPKEEAEEKEKKDQGVE